MTARRDPTHCFARRVNTSTQKYSTLPKFGIVVCLGHSGPTERAYRDRHDMGPDGGGRGSHQRERFCRAGNREQDGALSTGGMRVRQNRVVLAPEVLAPSLAVTRAARPGRRVGELRGDGGNSATLPGESAT